MIGRYALLALGLALVAGCAPAAAPEPVRGAASGGAPARDAPAPTTALAPATPSAPAARTRVRIGLQNIAIDVGVYLAAERGYFQQESIDAELVTFSNASEMVPALATDQLETAGISANAATWNAVGRGVALKIVLDKGSFRPAHGTTALLIRKEVHDRGRGHSMSDLRGLSLGFTPPGKGTVNAAIFQYALRPLGQTLDDLTIQPITFPDQVAALANGSVDGAAIAEPFMTRALRQGSSVKVMGLDEMYPNFTVSVLAFSPKLYGSREAAKGFSRAYIRGVRDYLAALHSGNPADRAPIDALIARETGLDVEIVRAQVPPGFNPNGLPNIESMVYSYEYFREQGLIPEPVSESAIAALWGTELVEEVLREIGRLPE